MEDIAGAWLMTSLAPDPLMSALLQTAIYLPFFLLSIPAGAMADLASRRTICLIGQVWMLVAVILLGILTVAGAMTSWLLIILTLLIGLGSAVMSPAWNALPPELVPANELEPAIALGGAGFNFARGAGAALGGLLVAKIGAGSVFLLYAALMIPLAIALFLWRPEKPASTAPSERVVGAMRAGLRYVQHSRPLRNVLTRTVVFAFCASAVWALFPLFARNVIGLKSTQYGFLISVFGLGTLAGAAVLPRVRQLFSLDRACFIGTLSFALAMFLLAFSRQFLPAAIASFGIGIGWISVGSCLNSGLLMACPSWVRARAVALYILTLNGCMAFGSLGWGCFARASSMELALQMGGVGLVLGLFLMRRFNLASAESANVSNSGADSRIEVVLTPHHEHGPVQVNVEYVIEKERAKQFVAAMTRLEKLRRRNGASEWHLLIDLTRPGTYIESYFVETWGERLRQEQRATIDDDKVEAEALSFHIGPEPPKTVHLLAERRRVYDQPRS